VSQAEARVEVFRRQLDGNWLFAESVGLDRTFRLESVDCEIALTEVYSQVTFDEGEPIRDSG